MANVFVQKTSLQISYGKTYVKICFKQPLFVQYTAVSSKIEN